MVYDKSNLNIFLPFKITKFLFLNFLNWINYSLKCFLQSPLHGIINMIYMPFCVSYWCGLPDTVNSSEYTENIR